MLSQKVIMVCQEFGDEPIELPLENDNCLLLSTLNSTFPNATGIKFRNPVNQCMRAVKLDNNLRFHPPGLDEEDGWDSNKIQYLCVFPKSTESKVTVEDGITSSASATPTPSPAPEQKSNGGAQPKTVDLIVLNLSSTTDEEGLREYFESKFGPLLMVELKRDRKTGNSRRFAFIRFRNYKEQMKALGQIRHKIDSQQVRLALPDFRDPSELYQENKCFIGRVNEQIKAGDLREFFSQFGDIVEISYPKKFKGYAFITFADPEVARKVCGQDFIVKGYSLCVSKSTHGNAKKDPQQFSQNYPQNNNYQDFSQDWNSPWYQGPSNNRQDPWMPGQKYVSAPLNPNYGNSLMQQGNCSPMINALSMAMQHANTILSGNYGNNYNRNNNGTALWGHQQQQQQQANKNNNNKKNNKKKSKTNAAKKTNEELAKRLEVKEGEGEENEEVTGDDDAKNDLSEGIENIDLKQDA